MTKPQRAALAAVPVISLGLLSWLPALYLWLRDPHARRPRLFIFVGLLFATAVLGAGLVTTEQGSGLSMLYGLLWIWLIATACTLTWFDSRPVARPAKDPYA